MFQELTKCVVCDSPALMKIFSLPDQELANVFHDGGTPLQKFPITIRQCPNCGHFQQKIAVDPRLLFKDYPYVSGTSWTLKTYFESFIERHATPMPARVLEIGCNDGTLLSMMNNGSGAFLGVEPAENLCKIVREKKIGVIEGMWDWDAQDRIARQSVDLIIAMNVIGHVSDPVEFLKLCVPVLAPGGRIILQTSQAHMLERGEFDTAYHEHVSFFTAMSFRRLAERVGLFLQDLYIADVHGGSYVVTLSKTPCNTVFSREIDERFFYRDEWFTPFWDRIAQAKNLTGRFVRDYRLKDYSIVAYGAPAKGMVFLASSGIEIDRIVDDSSLKIGKHCPTVPLVVEAPEVISEIEGPCCFLILAWNMFDEITEKIKALRPGKKDISVAAFPYPRTVEL